MSAPDKDKLSAYMRLIGLHRGEARAAYDAVAAAYDGFANLWDRHIAAPALSPITARRATMVEASETLICRRVIASNNIAILPEP